MRMNVADTIRAKLTEAFAPAALEIVVESHLHAGHAGHRPGNSTHFRVAIVAGALAGKGRVERQRLIAAALDELMGKPIHALALSAKAPGE
jgi:BolA protein